MATRNRGSSSGLTRRHVALLIITVVALLAAVGLFYYSGQRVAQAQRWNSQLDQLHDDVAQLTRISSGITSGQAQEYAAGSSITFLSRVSERVDRSLVDLRDGDAANGTPAMPGSSASALDALSGAWSGAKPSIKTLADGRYDYISASAPRAVLNLSIPELLRDYGVIARRIAAAGNAQQTYVATSQLNLLHEMRRFSGEVLSQKSASTAKAKQLGDLYGQFEQNNATIAGDKLPADVADQINQLEEKSLPTFRTAIMHLIDRGPELDLIKNAARRVDSIGVSQIEPDIDVLKTSIVAFNRDNRSYAYAAYAAGALSLLALALFIITFLSHQIRARREAEARDHEQQQAILNLLDEITDLANGDLTVNVTVSEDFTGAIADSINYTIQTLRTLVGTINRSSGQVVTATARTSEVARNMSADSDRQAQQITVITDAITDSSQQLQEVSARAERLSAQAQESVDVAHNGAATVGRTIQNMSALREQIQDTAKRIKRLGESSQEIGNIIEFIDDIAEQTNTLALNASIQAAMAGEAGRGFAVVAEQVQALAERAGSATRQVENLVKTIQADSQEAITSMERSTSNVVAGAQSAEEAGQSLTRVENASQELALVISEISVATRAQSERAVRIAQDMQSVRQIAIQTSGLAGQTASAVGEINALSDRLRESVADFTLPAPEDDEGAEPAPA